MFTQKVHPLATGRFEKLYKPAYILSTELDRTGQEPEYT
jgi:hypothetical protein